MKSTDQLVLDLIKPSLLTKHLNHLLLILYMNYVLHKLVNFIVIICRECDEFVPEHVHLREFELEHKIDALRQILAVFDQHINRLLFSFHFRVQIRHFFKQIMLLASNDSFILIVF
jgi:hypothetical protein